MLNPIVCSPGSKECMTHRCANCPKTSDDRRNHIYSLEDFDDDSQWTTTNFTLRSLYMYICVSVCNDLNGLGAKINFNIKIKFWEIGHAVSTTY